MRRRSSPQPTRKLACTEGQHSPCPRSRAARVGSAVARPAEGLRRGGALRLYGNSPRRAAPPSCAGAEPLPAERLQAQRFPEQLRLERLGCAGSEADRAARPSPKPRRPPPAASSVSRRPCGSRHPRPERHSPRCRGLEAGGHWRDPALRPPLAPRRGWEPGTSPRETEARRGAGEEGWSCDPRCHPGRGPSTGQEPGFPGETEARCQWARRGRGLWGAEHPTAPAKPAGAPGRARAIWAFLANFKPSRFCPQYSLGLRNLPEAVNSEGFPLPA